MLCSQVSVRQRIWEQAPTVSRSLAFTEPVVEPAQILPAIERLAHDLAKELSGRAARRLTLTASLPGGTRRASRLSKRPLTQARHIRQQALFALHDSRAQGQPIERITLEVTAPEPLGVQEGLDYDFHLDGSQDADAELCAGPYRRIRVAGWARVAS